MKIKHLIYTFILGLVLVSCDQDVDERRNISYLLHRAGYEPVRGVVEFAELSPAKLQVTITLENTDERYDFPAHLHFGDINEVGELAFRLEDVVGATGQSITILDQVQFPNGDPFTYDALRYMNGSVKIHLSDGIFGHKVLSYGNIGANENYLSDGMTICTGH
jgi:hypothetical protein